MTVEYRIEGKHHGDVTDEFVDRVTDPFYVIERDAEGKPIVGRLPKGIKLVEKRVYYLQVEEPIDEAIDRLLTKELCERFGVEVEKTKSVVGLK